MVIFPLILYLFAFSLLPPPHKSNMRKLSFSHSFNFSAHTSRPKQRARRRRAKRMKGISVEKRRAERMLLCQSCHWGGINVEKENLSPELFFGSLFSAPAFVILLSYTLLSSSRSTTARTIAGTKNVRISGMTKNSSYRVWGQQRNSKRLFMFSP